MPSGPPTNFSANAMDSRTITLTWGPPQADEQNGIVRHYFITLTSILPTETRNVTSPQSSIAITGLRPFTIYNCSIRAETVGLGPPAVINLISTPEDGMKMLVNVHDFISDCILILVPTGPPQNLSVIANTSRSLVLSWGLPLLQDSNGVIIDYTINITSSLGKSSFQVQSSATTYTITALRPFIAYTCVIAAHTTVGRGPFGGSVTLTTPEDAPEAPPEMVSQSNVMSRSVDLSWAAPRSDRQNGIIRHYIIEAYENDTGNTLTYQTPSDLTNFTLNNLHPYYTYSIRIHAFTVGPGPVSIAHTVNTLQDSK